VAASDDGQLAASHAQLEKIIDHEGNSVWTWYAVNLAGPYLLAERKVDRIVANPPWVRLSDIQVEDRKRAMEQFAVEQELQLGGKQTPHLDIASFFVLRTQELYAADRAKDVGAWLVKVSALRARQWKHFRKKHEALAQSLDLTDLQPFGGGDSTRCCILMEHRRLPGVDQGRVEVTRTRRRRPAPDTPLSSARQMIQFTSVPVPVPVPLPQAPSAYPDAFRQGATLVPYVLSAVARHRPCGEKPGWLEIETDKSKQKPWSDVAPQRGEVPHRWVRPVHKSNELLPYFVQKLPRAVVPTGRDGKLEVRDVGVPFWRELDEVYEVHRGKGKGTRKRSSNSSTSPTNCLHSRRYRNRIDAWCISGIRRPYVRCPCICWRSVGRQYAVLVRSSCSAWPEPSRPDGARKRRVSRQTGALMQYSG